MSHSPGNFVAAGNNIACQIELIPKRATPSIAFSNLAAAGCVATANFGVGDASNKHFTAMLGATTGSGGYIGSGNWTANARL